jgi:hypothetical protein
MIIGSSPILWWKVYFTPIDSLARQKHANYYANSITL